MTAAEDGANADLVVLNTCHIREKAVDKVYSDIGRLRARGRQPADDRGRGLRRAGRRARRSPPAPKMVDIVVGPQAYHRLPELMEKATRGERRSIPSCPPKRTSSAHLPGRTRQSARPTAFLTVQEGCDKFCTFCVVPYTRGAEISRPWARCSPRRRRWSMPGVREITLLGQNVNAFHGEMANAAWHGLSSRWTRIDGLARIRYTTSHPAT
jgi:tRNA-2-methylthio-N6-dimethylallyladenosine synthase